MKLDLRLNFESVSVIIAFFLVFAIIIISLWDATLAGYMVIFVVGAYFMHFLEQSEFYKKRLEETIRSMKK